MPASDGTAVRPATAADAEAICAIYNAALAERTSTFETEPRSGEDFEGRAGDTRFPLLVAEATQEVIGKLFTDNIASVRLVERCGFSAVGVHQRHGQLDGAWRDVLVVERLLDESQAGLGLDSIVESHRP